MAKRRPVIDFSVLPASGRPGFPGKFSAFLITDNWDDWFTYQTLYSLVVFDSDGTEITPGGIKIGQVGLDSGRPAIPEKFSQLDEEFFSVGQDEDFYDELKKLSAAKRRAILVGLNDIAFDEASYRRSISENVTRQSLFRFLNNRIVTGTFRRLSNGGARLSEYDLTFIPPGIELETAAQEDYLSFSIDPESNPPSNIHVLIGRNGVGKTHTLNKMTESLIDGQSDSGTFVVKEAERDSFFSNVVSVTFSAFDPFYPISFRHTDDYDVEKIQYFYIGLKNIELAEEGAYQTKTPEQLSDEFVSAFLTCRDNGRLDIWNKEISILQSDPVFKDSEVIQLSEKAREETFEDDAKSLFNRLSSGHKIVLLTITQLVVTVHERTLVLLDEPEAHLHPPLLSSFLRALSDLLIYRNGVAIIATHSPVVLQEVPADCVWKIRRSQRTTVFERPDIQTFGENTGILTSEVFRLEVTDSGFHELLKKAVKKHPRYDQAERSFGGQLGTEARLILRALHTLENEKDRRS